MVCFLYVKSGELILCPESRGGKTADESSWNSAGFLPHKILDRFDGQGHRSRPRGPENVISRLLSE